MKSVRPGLERFTAVAACALVAAAALPAAAEPVKEGAPLPDLRAFELEGALPGSLAGKVVLIDFWASWCGPCRKSFPALDRLHKAYGPKGLVVLGVNLDENRRTMDDFLRAQPVSFAVVRDARQKLVAAFGIGAMPTSILVDRRGVVRHVQAGFRGAETEKALTERIEAMLR